MSEIGFMPLPSAGLRIATGIYVGGGEHGADHPNTLTFPFAPKLVVISGANSRDYTGQRIVVTLVYGETSLTWLGGYSGDVRWNTTDNISWGNKSVSWYSSDATYGVYNQLNTQGQPYYYVALG